MKKKAFLYQRLYDDIRQKIEQGAFAAGQLLPSERELGDTYGVDRTTVRRALQMLSDDQLVSKLPGKGTIIAPTGSTVSQGAINTTNSSSEPMRTEVLERAFMLFDFVDRHGRVFSIDRVGKMDAIRKRLDGGVKPEE